MPGSGALPRTARKIALNEQVDMMFDWWTLIVAWAVPAVPLTLFAVWIIRR
jgi:hypothetical protein